MSLRVFVILILFHNCSAQFPELANTIWGKDSLVYGVKNVIGGVLAMDNVHNSCVQKTLCDEMSGEIVDNTLELDPVKRSYVPVPKIIKEKGRLRWIGDMFTNALGRIGRKMGIIPTNRRQSSGPVPAMFLYAKNRMSEIPPEAVVGVMDFVTDVSNTMSRNGAIYPYIRALTAGYIGGSGIRRSDDFDVCAEKIAPDCNHGWWAHLDRHNEYNGGHLTRNVQKSIRKSVQESRADGINGRIENPGSTQWNAMEPKDLFNPRIFLCKSSRFLRNLNEQVDPNNENFGSGLPEKDSFVNDDFETTCDPRHLKPKEDEENENTNQDSDDDETSTDTTIAGDAGEVVDSAPNGEQIIEAKGITEDGEVIDSASNGDQIIEVKGEEEGEGRNVQDLPILVLLDLPEPAKDQTEEELVESFLNKTFDLPQSSVKTAFRLPIRSNGKSVVMVEMDTIENEEKVLNKKLTKQNQSMANDVGIRKANYKELWEKVHDLSVAKWIEKDKIENLDENNPSAEVIQIDTPAEVIEMKENVPTENPKR